MKYLPRKDTAKLSSGVFSGENKQLAQIPKTYSSLTALWDPGPSINL